MSAKPQRNIRIAEDVAARIERIGKVLNRNSLSALCDIMLTEHSEMVENVSARKIPSLALEYDFRLKDREALPAVTVLASADDVSVHFARAAEEKGKYQPKRKKTA